MIEITNLTKRFGDKVAVDNITFNVNEGEIMGFLGPNGAGKSTTLNILTGYLSATSGSAKIDGIDVRILSAQSAASVSCPKFRRFTSK